MSLATSFEFMGAVDPLLLPITDEKIYDGWNYRVRGQNPATFFAIYDVVRRDTVSVAT